jgi:hypothetical protein
MNKTTFKKKLEEKLEAFFEHEDGKAALASAEGTDKEEFEYILDEFTYWIGRTDGL